MRKTRLTYNAPVTLTFALISLGSLILGYLTNWQSTRLLFAEQHSSLLNPLTYFRLFSHCLGHADFSHYIGNMSYFLLLGPMVEEKYGSKNLLIMIILTSGISGILNYIIFPNIVLCGASGIVFMLIVIASVTNMREGQIPITLILILLIYVGQEVYNAFFVLDNVSQFTHILGGICGAVFGMKFSKKSNY